MEKYSAYRDPGTGIQPFLVPIPPRYSATYGNVIKPLAFLICAARIILLSCLGIWHFISNSACLALIPVPALNKVAVDILTAVNARLILLVLGVYWIDVEIVGRKKGRSFVSEKWSPAAGDLVISNWISCLELLWLAFRLNPVFVLPLTKHVSASKEKLATRSFENRDMKVKEQTHSADVTQFTEASLFRMMGVCGYTPNYSLSEEVRAYTLGELLARAKSKGRSVVVLPECTTSNGRGLLYFVNVLKEAKLPKDGKIYIMCVRVGAPTTISPTVSRSIPTVQNIWNLPQYILSICCSIMPHKLSIKLLVPSACPSLDHDSSADHGKQGSLIDLCATATAEIGRLERTRMTWEDKAKFLELYRQKSNS